MQVTDSSEIKESDMRDIAERIKKVYDCGAGPQGSLPSGPSARPTASGMAPLRDLPGPADRNLRPMLAMG